MAGGDDAGGDAAARAVTRPAGFCTVDNLSDDPTAVAHHRPAHDRVLALVQPGGTGEAIAANSWPRPGGKSIEMVLAEEDAEAQSPGRSGQRARFRPRGATCRSFRWYAQ